MGILDRTMVATLVIGKAGSPPQPVEKVTVAVNLEKMLVYTQMELLSLSGH